MKRYQLYTILALILMTVGFTIPVIAYHGVANKIKNGAEIPSYVYPIYNLYTKIQYKNHLMAPEVRNDLAKMIQQKSGIECRSLILGHVQRGGTPTAFDRNLGSLYGEKCVEMILQGECGAVGYRGGKIIFVSKKRINYKEFIKNCCIICAKII